MLQGCGEAKTARRLAQKQPSLKECVTADPSSEIAPKMIGTQAIYRSHGLLAREAVGKRSNCSEVPGKPNMERLEVRMLRMKLLILLIVCLVIVLFIIVILVGMLEIS